VAGSLIFYIDYKKYRHAISPFVELADSGNYERVIQHTKEEVIPKVMERHSKPHDVFVIIDALDEYFALRDWPLPQHQESTNWIIGEAFLLMLLEYAELISHHDDVSLGVVNTGAHLLGWPKRARELLRIGFATTALIKPSQVSDPLVRPDLFSPQANDAEFYWWYLRGKMTMSVGWWSIPLIRELSTKLRGNYEELRSIELKTANDYLSRAHPSALSPRETLFYHIDGLLEVYQTALERKQGLLDIFG
jgi:hypothetical protein